MSQCVICSAVWRLLYQVIAQLQMAHCIKSIHNCNVTFNSKQVYNHKICKYKDWGSTKAFQQRPKWKKLRILNNFKCNYYYFISTCSKTSSLFFSKLMGHVLSQQRALFELVKVPILLGGISPSTKTSAMISCPLKCVSHFPRLKIMICFGKGSSKWRWKCFLPSTVLLQRKIYQL